MRKNSALVLLIIIIGLAFSEFIHAQEARPDGIYIIFDGSGSMWQKLPDETFKIEAAKQVLREFVTKDFSGFELAMRVYGHRRKGDCRDSELVIPFSPPEAVIAQLTDFMADINPTGKTPISFSFREALNDFGDRAGEIILISDGIETCDEDPCALIKEWQEKNVRIRIHVVGLGLDEPSREAMRCIADAAGTEYHDANSGSELADGLKQIQERAVAASFKLQGVDAEDNSQVIKGTLSQNGQERYKVASHRRHVVDAGEYLLVAGIETRNGNLYQPVTKTIQVAETGETSVQVQVAIPPSVKAKFVDQGDEESGSLITAYQNGAEVFKFRWMDEIYLNEGTYEFRAQPRGQSELSVTESFAAGYHKEIVFEMVHTVRAKFKLIAAGSGIWFRQNYELWQNGEKKYAVHANNGALVLPGTYELRMPNEVTPFAKDGIVITGEDEQFFEVQVPVGHVTVVYQRADGTKDKDDRCFIGAGPSKRGKFKMSGEKHPLVPGTYNVTGWTQKGEYDPVVFEIEEGKDIEVVLRAKK